MSIVYSIIGLKGYYRSIKDARAYVVRYGKPGKTYSFSKWRNPMKMGQFAFLEPDGFTKGEMSKHNGIWQWEIWDKKHKRFAYYTVNKDGSIVRM